MSEAFVYDAIRTPRGKGKKDGSLHEVKPVDLLAGVLAQLQSRNQLDTAALDDVVILHHPGKPQKPVTYRGTTVVQRDLDVANKSHWWLVARSH